MDNIINKKEFVAEVTGSIVSFSSLHQSDDLMIQAQYRWMCLGLIENFVRLINSNNKEEFVDHLFDTVNGIEKVGKKQEELMGFCRVARKILGY